MTQDLPSPHRVIAERVRALRRGRGMSAHRLAERLTAVGIDWDRSIVANLETGRRSVVSVEEFLALAVVLDVAPVHLLLPVDAETARYAYVPARTAEVWRVREWVRGHPYAAAPSIGLGGVDRRHYLPEVPAVEVRYPPKPTSPLQTVRVVPEPDSTPTPEE